jgi:feruloyl esterase
MKSKTAVALGRWSAASLTVATLAACGGSDGPVACAELAKLSLPEATILTAATVPAGSFTPVAGAATEANMPSFCRVTARVNPEIDLEIWLPEKNWNRRFLGTGNGGFAGSIQSFPQMADAVRRGFAVAATNAGHTGSQADASWALNSNQRIADFGDRALHEMTVKAKSTINKFYGFGPDKSYYNGCSTGGRQGLMEA